MTTVNSPTPPEIWEIAARTHQLIATLDVSPGDVDDVDTILLAFLRELSTRQDIELLSNVFGKLDDAERQIEAEQVERYAAAERRQLKVTAATTVECPKCKQPAESPCHGPRRSVLTTPHEARIRSAADGQWSAARR